MTLGVYAMANLEDIAEKVLERTREGKLSWEITVDEDVFQAVIGENSILVTEHRSFLHSIRILDEQGRELDTLVYKLSDDGDLLQRVYIEAKRKALNTDVQLSELLEKLEA